MHKFIPLLFFLTSLHAEIVNPPVLVNFGINPFCSNPTQPVNAGFLCEANAPVTNTYMLIMSAHSPRTTAFRYMVTGTLGDGTVKTLKAEVDRTPGAPYTNVLVSFGGVVSDVKIQVEEFALVAVTTASN
jgi:hypothetical protein